MDSEAPHVKTAGTASCRHRQGKWEAAEGPQTVLHAPAGSVEVTLPPESCHFVPSHGTDLG